MEKITYRFRDSRGNLRSRTVTPIEAATLPMESASLTIGPWLALESEHGQWILREDGGPGQWEDTVFESAQSLRQALLSHVPCEVCQADQECAARLALGPVE